MSDSRARFRPSRYTSRGTIAPRVRAALLAGALLLGPGATAGASPQAHLLLDVGVTDNVMRAHWSPDIKSDGFIDLSAELADFRSLGARSAIEYGLRGSARRYELYRRLGREGAAALLRYHWRAGNSPYAPTLSFGASGGVDTVDSALRSGGHWQLSLALQQRLTTRVGWAATLRRRVHDADHPVFAGALSRIDLHLDWELAPHYALYLDAHLGHGDQVFSTRWMNGAFTGAAQRAVADDAFGEGVTAYRFDGGRRGLGLGLNISLGARLSLDTLGSCNENDAFGGRDYRDCQLRLGLLLRAWP